MEVDFDSGNVKTVPTPPEWPPLDQHWKGSGRPVEEEEEGVQPLAEVPVVELSKVDTPNKWRGHGFVQAQAEAELAYEHLLLALEWYQGLEPEDAATWRPHVRKIGDFVEAIQKRAEIG